MRKMFSVVTVLVVGAVVALAATFFVGMRTKAPFVQDRVRRFNKKVGNPKQMQTAGQRGAWTSVVRHVGRVSGTAYETPVEAHPSDDGFVISLPYGASTDWVKNVLAAGRATLVRDGGTYEVERPEIVPVASVMRHLPAREQTMLRVFDVRECLHLRTTVGDRVP